MSVSRALRVALSDASTSKCSVRSARVPLSSFQLRAHHNHRHSFWQQQQQAASRAFSTSPAVQRKRGADVPSEATPTDLGALDMFGNTPPPSTSVDVCMYDGFGLNSGVTIRDGNGALLFNGEAFEWRPWEAKGEMRLINDKGQFEVPAESLAVLDLLWPRPDLLIIGVGKNIVPLSPETKKALGEMGLRVDVLDTRNAASQFNMLATERGVSEVAAALIPLGWKEGEGAK
jgi:NADH dehydrogenase [ubiquinone] 1 alpha subcomplex assembly factor 3